MADSAIRRAEQVLNNISYALRDIQREVYTTQDRIAKQTQDVYSKQKLVLGGKPVAEMTSAGLYLYFYKNPDRLTKYLKIGEKEAFETLGRATSVFPLVIEPFNAHLQAQLQPLQTGQAEGSTLQNSLQTMIQTHDAAIQRLQNMESANRQAG